MKMCVCVGGGARIELTPAVIFNSLEVIFKALAHIWAGKHNM